MCYSTYVGRIVVLLFPVHLRNELNIYLAPAFGLALTQIFIAVWGRYYPFGDAIIFPFLMLALLIIVTLLENHKCQALKNCLITSIFGLLASISLLISIYKVGALNPFNDTFTYLAHSDWLQKSAFNETINDNLITPAATQIALYQKFGFRMGGSYLLGLFQSILNVQWAFDIYPGVMCATMACTCLAAGYPIFRDLSNWPLYLCLGPLTMISNSLGGVNFAANYGFMAQEFGILFGAGLLFIYGPILSIIGNYNLSKINIVHLAFPVSLLLSASIFSYSEFSPFIIVSLFFSIFLAAYKYNKKMDYFYFCLVVIILSIIFLNVEILRTAKALLIQSSVIVGSPIEWSLMGFFAHAIGIHGGGWDIAQWTLHSTQYFFLFEAIFALMLFLAASYLIILSTHYAKNYSDLTPIFFIIYIFLLFFLYFRYIAHNPFNIGVGQSWSQFKLSDWAQIFVAVFILRSLLIVCVNYNISKWLTIILGFIGCIVGLKIGLVRSSSLFDHYKINEISLHYKTLRKNVARICHNGQPIYLNLDQNDSKYRQIMSLFLDDRYIKSDWEGDDYVEHELPLRRRNERMSSGDCLIESFIVPPTSDDLSFGKLRIVPNVGADQALKIVMIESVNARESNSKDWWIWFDRKAKFVIKNLMPMADNYDVTVYFETNSNREQKLIIQQISDNVVEDHVDKLVPKGHGEFNVLFHIKSQENAYILFLSDDKAETIGKDDKRLANFQLMNLSVKTAPMTDCKASLNPELGLNSKCNFQ